MYVSVSRQPKSPRLNEEGGGDCRLLNCFLLAPSSILRVSPNNNDRKYQPDDAVAHSRLVYIQKPGSNSSLPPPTIFHCSCWEEKNKRTQDKKISATGRVSCAGAMPSSAPLLFSSFLSFFIFPVLINKIHLFAAWLLLLLFTRSKDPKGVMNTQENPSRRQHHHTHTALSLVSSIDCAQHNSERKSAAYQPPPPL